MCLKCFCVYLCTYSGIFSAAKRLERGELESHLNKKNFIRDANVDKQNSNNNNSNNNSTNGHNINNKSSEKPQGAAFGLEH
jgi:hypothetical protein